MEKDNLTKTENIIDDLVKNKLTVIIIIVGFLLVAIILTAFQKREYMSSAQVLIIQEQEHQMDAYLASKSSESLAKNLRKAILTSSFRNKVMESAEDLEVEVLTTEKNRRKEWLRMVDVKIIPNTSILEIKTYHSSTFQAEKILNKVLSVLLENHQFYHGGGDDIRLEIINNPLTSYKPVRPNWVLNLSLSFILALFFIITLLILFPNKVYFLNQKIDKSKFNIKKTGNLKNNFKVFDYLDNQAEQKVNLPADLFQEENIVDNHEEGFFIENEAVDTNKSLNSSLESKTVEVKNNEKIKEIIGNNHYLKSKE